MRTIPALVLLIAGAAAPTLAQSDAPAPVSLGGDIGIFAPSESGSGSSVTARFTADFYWWQRQGMRFAAGFANPTLGDTPNDASADMVYVSAGVIQRVTESSAHPYFHGDVGVFHFSGGLSETDLGLALGGGLEFASGIKGVLLTPEVNAYMISGSAPRFSLALTIGLHSRPH